MLESLLADAAKQPSLAVAVLVDRGLHLPVLPGVHRLEVPPGDDMPRLVAAARKAAWTLIVAPEGDGILADRVQAARAAGGRVLAPRGEAIAIAADKQATINALAAHGVPVPAGRSLPAGLPPPADFRLPAVRKARHGCGCEELRLLRSHIGPPASAAMRIEAHAQGTPVGVSLLCGAAGVIPLEPMRQRFTTGDTPRYTGSELLDDPDLATRAGRLGIRAAAAIGAEAGWMGVDMMLGDRPDGRDDRVLEINPRVTTSFVGQTRLFASSLIAAMIKAATGGVPDLVPAPVERSLACFRIPGE